MKMKQLRLFKISGGVIKKREQHRNVVSTEDERIAAKDFDAAVAMYKEKVGQNVAKSDLLIRNVEDCGLIYVQVPE